MPPLKVLHVLNDLAGGGAERLVLDLCRHASPGISTQVVTVMEGGVLGPSFAEAGIRVRSAGRTRYRPGIRALMQLKKWCSEVDVVHTHLWGGDFFGGVGAWAVGRPVISTVHNTRGDGGVRDWLLSRSPSPMISVGVSPAAREMAAEAGAPEESLRCIPNGVDLTRFSPIPWTPGPPWRLLMVGRLTAQKGIDRLIRALEGIEEVELHLVGEGEEEGPLRGLARELRVPSVFHGWQANIAGYYADAHVLLLPSRWEGFGLVAVEAMASGRPVISSAVDGLDEVLGEVGIRVQGDEMDDLRKAIQQALGQPEDLRERGLAGPVQAARFGIRRTVMAYEKLYRELAASSIQP